MATQRITVVGSFTSGESWANVLHFLDGGVAPDASGGLFDKVDGFYAGVMTRCSYMVQVVRLVAKNLDDGTVRERLTPRQGGINGPSLPFDVSCVVSLRTDLRSRKGRGRIFLPPFGREQVDGDPPSFLQAAVDQIKNSLVANLLSTSAGDHALVVRSAGAGDNIVTSGYVDRRPDTQRGRDQRLTFGRSTF